MIITLENACLTIAVKSTGAELCNVIRKDARLEYIWSGDPSVWGKTSPMLFPIVGTLKNDTYIYKNEKYKLSRHGFARDEEFEIVLQEQQHVVFLLKDTPGSFVKYPFAFELLVDYALDNDVLKVSYQVRNTGTDLMYFSLGAHPAFKVPLLQGTIYEDYFLQFDSMENAAIWPVNKEGLIGHDPVPFLNNSSRIDLSHKLFDNDALVFKDIHSGKVSLKTDRHPHGLEFYFEGFPFLGLWAAKGGNFLCIEPWCGIADAADHDQMLINKEGIQVLPVSDTWRREWKVRYF
ncbi:MAG: aldose 1-epimerase family protein [Ginsengibacter sp.]